MIHFQVTTTTKTIREIQYIGPDGQPLEYVPTSGTSASAITHHPRLSTSSAGGYDPSSAGLPPGGYPGPPPIEQRSSSSAFGGPGGPPPLPPPGGGGQQQQGYANYAEYPHRPPTPPSPSDRSNSPPPQHREPGKIYLFIFVLFWASLQVLAIFLELIRPFLIMIRLWPDITSGYLGKE